MSRGFLTIAFGDERYLEMARGLARSLRCRKVRSRIAIVTDRPATALQPLFDEVIPLDLRFGSGVEQKLYVDLYSPFDRTLFVDSDCLAFADPEQLWLQYEQATGIGIKGWAYLGATDPHYGVKDMPQLFEATGISRLGALNTGLFYFDDSPLAKQLFASARALAQRSESLGLRRFKNAAFADEPVIALALETHAIEMLPWDEGRAMCTASAPDLRGLEDIDVLRGRCRLHRYGTFTEPVILHFHLGAQEAWPYYRELARLRLGKAAWGPMPTLGALPGWMRSSARRLPGRVRHRLCRAGPPNAD